MMGESKQHRALLIKNARIIDPVADRDIVGDLAVVDGVIVDHAPRDAEILDAAGKIVCPGLMDIHVHLRDPGQTHKEDLETGTDAAAGGGFTYVACMPNTRPPLDSVDAVRYVLRRAQEVGACTVGPIACITKNRAGAEVADMPALLEAGAVAFSDDGDGVEDDGVMREAFVQAKQLGTVLIQHCEYKNLSAGGVMHLGEASRRLGLPGLDPRSEEAMIERDIALSRATGGRYHVAHISTANGVAMVRRAKQDGVPVTAEVCPHHLLLTDEDVRIDDPNTKMHPPLRSPRDVEACREGLLDATIDCIVTDHAPHTKDEKAVGFLNAPPGIVGVETAVALAAKAMVASGLATWTQLIEWFTVAPARVLNMEPNRLDIGQTANLTIIDPNETWTVEPKQLRSRSKNTPFGGWILTGRASGTLRGTDLRVCRESAGPASPL